MTIGSHSRGGTQIGSGYCGSVGVKQYCHSLRRIRQQISPKASPVASFAREGAADIALLPVACDRKCASASAKCFWMAPRSQVHGELSSVRNREPLNRYCCGPTNQVTRQSKEYAFTQCRASKPSSRPRQDRVPSLGSSDPPCDTISYTGPNARFPCAQLRMHPGLHDRRHCERPLNRSP